MLDYNEIKISNTTEKEKQLKKRIIQRINKDHYRLHTFQFLTKYIGRGVNGLLKWVHSMNNKGRIVKTHTKREEIEEQLINHNRQHYTKVFETLIYNDKIYEEL